MKTKRSIAMLTGVLVALLSVGATALTSTASAEWQQWDCIKIAAGSGGGYSGATCGTAEFNGPYARTRARTSTTAYACYIAGSGGEGVFFTDPNCKIEGTPKLYEWVQVPIVGEEYYMKGKGSIVLSATPFGVATHVECNAVRLEADPEDKGKQSNGLLELTGCTATKPANCTVTEPTFLEYTGQLEGGAEKPLDLLTGKKAEASFGEVTLQGATCSLKGKPFGLSGTQKCAFDAAIQTFSEEHELICTTAGSTLKAGGKIATLEGTVKYKQSISIRGAIQQYP